MTSFNVTTSNDRIRLGADGRGRAQFTAVNSTPRSIRGRGRVVPQGDSRQDWFSLDGDAQRQFAPGSSEQFTVAIQLPTAGAAGEHRFRLDVVGVENPDEDYGQGPVVTVVLGAAPTPPARSRGYLTTVVGAVAGALLGGLVGTLPGTLVLISMIHQQPSSSPGSSIVQAVFEGVLAVIVEAVVAAALIGLGLLVGIWVGPVLGALVSLRTRAQSYVGLTVGLLAAFQLVVTVILVVLLVVIGNAIKNGTVVLVVAIALAVVDVAVPALLARAAARLIRTHSL